MSYDLNFWKYADGVWLDHQAVYEKLSDGETVEGVEELPADLILVRVETSFADWTRTGNMWESDEGAFEVCLTSQLFRVDCYGLSGETMNRFIDIAHEFGCPLYDPQVGKRFDMA